MDLAAKFLEDRSFMEQFLRESHRELLRSRLLVEDLLKKAKIKYHDKGYVQHITKKHSLIRGTEIQDSLFGLIYHPTSQLTRQMGIRGLQKGNSLHTLNSVVCIWTKVRSTVLRKPGVSGWSLQFQSRR